MSKKFNWLDKETLEQKQRGLEAKEEFLRTKKIIKNEIKPFYLMQISQLIADMWSIRVNEY